MGFKEYITALFATAMIFALLGTAFVVASVTLPFIENAIGLEALGAIFIFILISLLIYSLMYGKRES